MNDPLAPTPEFIEQAKKQATEDLKKLTFQQYDAIYKYNYGITQDQFVEVLQEAIDCGDFQSHIEVHEWSPAKFTYHPYTEKARLEAKMKELEAKINKADDILAHVEDTAHGHEGDDITRARKVLG